tara:strand:- start:50011 stop:51507 length:1497 start_codon:yes stop_codon:yes gene_type:complete
MKKIQLTGPQLMVALAIRLGKNKIYLEWGRGSGKSTILGYIIKELCKQMPRACFTLVGETYMQVLSVTLKSAKAGMEMFGLYEDIDYVVGKSGKSKGFVMPFERPDKWHNIIHFSNGCIIQLVSLENKNSGRGLNSYAEIGDEAALFDKEKLFVNVSITNRAGRKQFPNASLLNAEIYMSSTPLTSKGKWFTNMEKEAAANPKEYAYIKANAYSNKENLPEDYFIKMRKNAPTALYYRAEILNIRPSEIKDGFYAQLSPQKHYYKTYIEESPNIKASTAVDYQFTCEYDTDLDRDAPLIISLDFGVFNSLSVHQRNGREHRVLKSFYVLSPKILADLLEEQFIPYYKAQRNRRIEFYFGHDGNNRQANSKKTLAQEAADILRKAKFKVNLRSKGKAPTHMEKYIVINTLLKESNAELPVIRINERNNQDLIVSLENATVKEGGTTALHKDKSSEKSNVIKQQHATHLSDTFDIPIYELYQQITLRSRSNRDYMPITTG